MKEALKLALEALEYWDVHGGLNQPTEEAITAIKASLAQDEPVDETAEPCPSCGKPLQSAAGGGVVCSERCGYWFCF